MLDESLEIIAGLWEGHPFRFDGAQYTVDEVTFTPTPHQRPSMRTEGPRRRDGELQSRFGSWLTMPPPPAPRPRGR